jgi:hypothetical protein
MLKEQFLRNELSRRKNGRIGDRTRICYIFCTVRRYFLFEVLAVINHPSPCLRKKKLFSFVSQNLNLNR